MRWRLLPCVLLLFCAGCLHYDERMELNADGSGVVRIHLAISEQIMAMHGYGQVKKPADLYPMPPDQFAKELRSEGLTVKSVRAESKAGLRHFYIVIAFKNVQDLVKSDYFAGRTFAFDRRGDGTWHVRQTLDLTPVKMKKPASSPEPGQTGDKDDQRKKPEPPKKPTGPDVPKKGAPGKGNTVMKQFDINNEKIRRIVKGAVLTFSVQLKNARLVRTDGIDHRGRVAIWTFPLADVLDKSPKISMDAVFAPGKGKP